MQENLKSCDECKNKIASHFSNKLKCDVCNYNHNFHLECFYKSKLKNSDFPEKCFLCNRKLKNWVQTKKGMKIMLIVFLYFYLIGIPLLCAAYNYPEQLKFLIDKNSIFIFNYLILIKFWFDGFFIQNCMIVTIEILIVLYSLIFTFLS